MIPDTNVCPPHRHPRAMASVNAALPARVTAVDAGGLAARAAEVAARERSPQTRRTHTAVYRSLITFLGEHATVEDLTPEAVRGYRDALEHANRTPTTIAKHLSAIRGPRTGTPRTCSATRSARTSRAPP